MFRSNLICTIFNKQKKFLHGKIMIASFSMFEQNFHLMDYHLAIFITVMLARRLVWTIVSEVNTQHTISSNIKYT